MNKKLFSNRLQETLNSNYLTPLQLASKTNISMENISSYLSGKLIPNSINLRKIATALNVSDTWLRGDDIYNNNYFSHNLKYLLDSNRITVKEILKITNMKSPAIVTRWKTGERKIMTKDVVALANYLNLTVDDLYNRDITQGREHDEIELLYSKYKDILTELDKTLIKTIIEQRIKEENK